MKSNKLIIYCLLGVGVLIGLLLSYSLFHNDVLFKIGGDKGVVVMKSVESFYGICMPPLAVHEKYLSVLPHHRYYVADRDWFMEPSDYVVIAVGEDHVPHSLPGEFNDLVKDENVYIDSEGQALWLCRVYLNCTAVYGDNKLLFNVSDIPGLSGDYHYSNINVSIPSEELERLNSEKNQLVPVITYPKVTSNNNTYTVAFYSWNGFGGNVYRWKINIARNGMVDVISREQIGYQIGLYLVL